MIALFRHKRQMTDEEFDTLFRQSYPKLYRLAFSMLNDQEDSRDVVSGVFADLLDKPHLPAPINEGYLMAMVHNRALNLLKHRRVENEARADMLHAVQSATSPCLADDDRLVEVLTFIETQLTPQTRRVLTLCFDEKKTYQQAASELGVSVQAINKHISQALRKLRERFNPLYKRNR
ncbi:MAG: sigma-70 family RNA polymerase sigma factor [Bacteroidales bacterium]|nr:sigma-70 family RNA polymerase sigma factor [Bacteroidales bacterium]